MNKFLKALFKKKQAAGGLVIIIVSIIGATSLNYTTRLSSEDLARSVCDEAAHFTTFRAASYLDNAAAPSGTYSVINDSNGNHLDLASEYSRFINTGFEGKAGSTGTFVVYWNKSTKTATMTAVGGVDTMLNGEPVQAELQSVTIE